MSVQHEVATTNTTQHPGYDSAASHQPDGSSPTTVPVAVGPTEPLPSGGSVGTDIIYLNIIGIPVTQGSGRAVMIGGRARFVQGSSNTARRKLDNWRGDIAAEARAWCARHGNPPLINGPVSIDATFFLPKPISTPKWRWLPWSSADLDKLQRATSDALTGVIYTDDRRVTDWSARKRFAIDRAPGVELIIEQLDERKNAA